MSGCGHCSGNCESCGGCQGALVLTEGEAELLRKLAQIPFLPVARRADDAAPVYLEDDAHTREEYSLILQCLEKKALIDLDYGAPLKGLDYSAYAGLPVRGSFALTRRGQQVLETMEILGTNEATV